MSYRHNKRMQIAFAPVTNLQLFSPKRPLSRTKAPVSRTFEKLSFGASCATSSRSALIYEADDATKPNYPEPRRPDKRTAKVSQGISRRILAFLHFFRSSSGSIGELCKFSSNSFSEISFTTPGPVGGYVKAIDLKFKSGAKVFAVT